MKPNNKDTFGMLGKGRMRNYQVSPETFDRVTRWMKKEANTTGETHSNIFDRILETAMDKIEKMEAVKDLPAVGETGI